MATLEKIANSIPSQGGREIGYYLREKAEAVAGGNDIIEVGSWLGAGTAQLCLGIIAGEKDITLHVYDRFIVNATEVKKALKQGLKLKKNQNTLPIVKKYIVNFKCNVEFNKGYVSDIYDYTGNEIGLYVDDASKKKESFDNAMNIFKPHFIPDETILILMDYFYFEWREKEGPDYQFNYMQNNPEFEFIERILPDPSAAAFIYRGIK